MMNDFDDDDEDSFEKGLYVDGHWIWCNKTNQLIFVRTPIFYLAYLVFSLFKGTEMPKYRICDVIEKPKSELIQPTLLVCGPTSFHDEMDVIEQVRYRKRMQRKSEGENDVILLQDVKDYVLYTAPLHLLSHAVIYVLHLPGTERFLRSLILYCQYYMQTVDESTRRTYESNTKIPTENSMRIENTQRTNLQDIRLLLVKEYATFLIGGSELRKFHHMGKDKKRKSLTRVDGILFECILILSIQIVWLALGRQWYRQIECEVNRLLRSDSFNIAEHRSASEVGGGLNPREQSILRGNCTRNDRKLHTRSPLLNEVMCRRDIDYRLYEMGTIKLKRLNWRLQYLESLLTVPESQFQHRGVALGIIGLQRNKFDTCFRPIRKPTDNSSSSRLSRYRASTSRATRMSTTTVFRVGNSLRKASSSNSTSEKTQIYPNIVIPEDLEEEQLVTDNKFPTEALERLTICEAQYKKWKSRYKNLKKKKRGASSHRSQSSGRNTRSARSARARGTRTSAV